MRATRSIAATVVAVVLLSSCSGSSSSTTSSSGAPASSTSSAASSSSSSVSPTTAGIAASAYAQKACTAMKRWVASIQQRSQSFQTSGSNLENVKEAWLDFLDGAIQDTGDMISKLESLGTPAVTGGEDAASQLIAALQQLEDAFTALRDDSAQLSTDSSLQFQKDFQALLKDFQGEMNRMGAAFSQISNPELDQAFNDNPICTSLSQ